MSAGRAEKLCYLLVPGQDQTVPLLLKLRAQEKGGRQLICRKQLLGAVGSNKKQKKHWGQDWQLEQQRLWLPLLPACLGQNRDPAVPVVGVGASCPTHTWGMLPGPRGESFLGFEKKFVFICLQFALP